MSCKLEFGWEAPIGGCIVGLGGNLSEKHMTLVQGSHSWSCTHIPATCPLTSF